MSAAVREPRRRMRFPVVIASGLSLGILLWLVDSGSHSGPGMLAGTASPAQGREAAHDAASSGVFVASAQPQAPHPPPMHAEARPPQAPALPFSFLGKITEDGAPTILLYGDAKTFKVRAAGPLDDRYVVDDVYEDRLVIRYLPLGTQQVLPLASRQYDVPASLRGEYPQD